MFSNQAVQSFQTKFLRTEINKARTDEENVEVKLDNIAYYFESMSN